jgi:hypothetical protein
MPGMKQPVAVARPQHYSDALAGVWRALELALARLDGLAALPAVLVDPERGTQLAVLQYRLHAASEAVLALAPPAGAEDAHSDLADALVAAREATAAVALALEEGEPVGALVYEWRGALFRVRLARRELTAEPAAPALLTRTPWVRVQGLLLLAVALAGIGFGAHASAWLLVAAGATAVVLAVALLLRP